MNCGVIVDNELNSDVRVLREAVMLRDAGYKVCVLCFGFRKEYMEPAHDIPITRIRIPGKLKDILFFALNTIPLYEWLWARHTAKFIKANNIEILHVHDLYMSRSAYRGIKKSKISSRARVIRKML